MQIKLGYKPHDLEVEVVKGVPFYSSAFYSEDDVASSWPAGTVLTLRHALGVWTAQINGAVASWNVPAAQVDAVLNSDHRAVALWYSSDTQSTPIVWAQGSFKQVKAR